MASFILRCGVIHKVSNQRFIEKCFRACMLSSKIPEQPQWIEIDPTLLRALPEISNEMLNHLERLSLVEFNNKAGVECLCKAIEYANRLSVVDTEGVVPMYSVLEDQELLLRDDVVTEGGCKVEILQNASKQEEGYFVAPPGNIPLVQNENTFN